LGSGNIQLHQFLLPLVFSLCLGFGYLGLLFGLEFCPLGLELRSFSVLPCQEIFNKNHFSFIIDLVGKADLPVGKHFLNLFYRVGP
jgi:hypothetical protein